MKSPAESLEAKAAKLYHQWAAAQAVADQLSASLNKLKAKITDKPAPETGLDLLWAAAPAIARTRSSRVACRTAWNRLPRAERPRVAVAVEALKAWARCEEWKKDDGQFVPALHRWIKEQKWLDVPEAVRVDPSARYRCHQPPPPPPVAPEDVATPEDIAEMFRQVNAALEGKFASNDERTRGANQNQS